MIFLSENFSFNNVSNKSMGVEIITFDDEMFYQRGISYQESIDRVDGSQQMPLYTSTINDSVEDVVLRLLLVENGKSKVWTEEKINEVMDWLVTDDFKPFISGDNWDLVYYFKVSNITKYFTLTNTGYLEVIFKPYSNYCYLRKEYITNNLLNIRNESNVEGVYKPVIKITNGSGTVSITNKTTNEILTINNVSEEIIIDNLYRTVQTVNGENKLSSCNRGWISLIRGLNEINVSGGTVKFICEFPVIR